MAASPPKLFSRSWKVYFLISCGGRLTKVQTPLDSEERFVCFARRRGVGFRLLEDIHRAFSIKLWWNFRSKSSLWVSFMHAKFCRVVHPNLVFFEKGSEGWRRMVKVRALAERHIGWIIWSESSNFWFDNWLGTGGLADWLDSVSDHKVAEFVQGGSRDVRRISQWVPLDIVAEIGQTHPPVGSLPDLMVWRPEPSGHFTLKTAFSLVQHHSRPSLLFNRIWHPGVPLRVSFFLLRLLRDRLPLDCSVWKLGIQGPSRCLCCPSPEIETTEHLFGDGVMARYVWRFFGAPVGIGCPFDDLLASLEGSQRYEVRGQEDCRGTGMSIDLIRDATVVQDPVSGLSGSVVVVDPVPFGHINMETGGFT
ncbi:uncharacterized protein [Coffea arabica]|uniref:Reverse transcriptase zinc-binding domain-containing protein n=1 Tax=Coffea arabica TaxID=13443 RepID=A0ABM4WPY4_COFAR